MTVEEWNEKYPVGTKVRYFPIKENLDEYEDTITRSPAWEMCDSGIVSLEGKSGGYSLDHITPLD